LETEAWRVVSRRNERGGALIVISIDEIAREDIVAKGHQLNFRYGTIPVSGLKKGKAKSLENPGQAGEKAALTMAPECPPPTNESVTQGAGPSSMLEDLAEDEDLLDMTMDHAVVESMEEAAAMSSQELEEELQNEIDEADKTLCNDLSASRPQSPWPIEPLL